MAEKRADSLSSRIPKRSSEIKPRWVGEWFLSNKTQSWGAGVGRGAVTGNLRRKNELITKIKGNGEVRETGCKVRGKEVEVSAGEAAAELYGSWWWLDFVLNLCSRWNNSSHPVTFSFHMTLLYWPSILINMQGSSDPRYHLGTGTENSFAHLLATLLREPQFSSSAFPWPWLSSLEGGYWSVSQQGCLTFLTILANKGLAW